MINAIGNYIGSTATISTSPSFDASYQAVLDQATTLGYTLPSASQQTKQNTLVAALKSNGIWDLLDAFYVFATDATLQFASLNWKASTTFQITYPVSPTLTINQGLTGNGTTQYASVPFNLSTNGVNYTLNASSIGCHIFNHVSEAKIDFGTAPAGSGSGPQTSFRANDGFGSTIYMINQAPSALVASGADSSGFFHVQRKDAANVYLFKNGIQVDTEADAATALPSGNITLLGLNNGGTPGVFTTRKMSCFFIAASLDTKESAFYTAWNTYLTSL